MSLFLKVFCLNFLSWGSMISTSLAKQNFLAINCSYDTVTLNSTYNINLSKLLHSLTSKTTITFSTGLFSNIVTGSDVESSSTVYSQFFCQGDYINEECKNCVANATKLLIERCPTSISAHIWYEDCKFHYSNVRFFGVYNESSQPVWFLKSDNKVSAPDTKLLAAFVATTISELAKQVASSNTDMDNIQSSSLGGGAKYFGTKVINFTTKSFDNQRHVTTLFEMVQCTPDLSVQDCNSCLTSMINQFSKYCKGMLGGRVATHNCYLRFETYPFYNISATMEASLPLLFTTSPMASNTANNPLGKISLKIVIAITIPAAILLGLTTFGIGLCVWKVNRKRYSTLTMSDDNFDPAESLEYSYDEIKAATRNFSDDNKIGHGGFGCVYKGILQDGQEIAVKKLFRRSNQVVEEFKNEVEVLAKLQHRNLVRLLGFCLAEGENLLVFEYVPNKSLDKLLFDTEEGVKLNWFMRFKIIVGIARGLMYLHEESRHSIVHRDLKPGNILIDEQLNPKIADFGMARFYGLKQEPGGASKVRGPLIHSGIDQTHQSTHRGGGTLGYMAPEIAQKRQFSVKTDVYSYGVMVLEIISGKRNTHFHLSGLAEDLLSYSWIQWKKGTPLTIIDEVLVSENGFPCQEMRDQALMCVHLSLLCIQKDAKVRPTMGMIVYIFANFEAEFKKWTRSIL